MVRRPTCFTRFGNGQWFYILHAILSMHKIPHSYVDYFIIFSLPFLFAVLEARIQQLQSDVIVDVQHEKVQFVKASKSGIGASSGNSPKNVFGERTEVPKVGQTISKGAGQTGKGRGKDASASKSRWMETLSQEKKTKKNTP